MNARPLRNLILVTLRDAPTTSVGLLEVVKFDKTPSMFADTDAVGPDVREVSVGDRIVVSRLQGVTVDNQVLLPETAVLARVPYE